MAWKFSVKGADTFDNDGEKVAFERHLVEEVRAFVARIAVKPSVQVEDGSVDVDTQDAVSLKPPSDSTPVPEEAASDG